MMRIQTLALFLLLALCALRPSHSFLVSVAEEQEIEVVSNPHDTKRQSCLGSPLEQLLEPHQLIVTPMLTQADTFQKLSYAKVLTVPVPVYKMKQPARLAEAQLEFQMVLVKELGSNGANNIQEVPFPMEKALDSWFPGYYWAPLVMQCSENHYQHVGWKFTAVEENSNQNNKFPHFYALLVQMDQKQKTQGLRVGGFKAPGWMVAAVLS